MITDADRAAFEEWAVSSGGYHAEEVSTKRGNGKYFSPIEGDWIVWQAALSNERARRAEAYAGLVAEAQKVAAREIVAGFDDAYQVGLIRRLVEALK